MRVTSGTWARPVYVFEFLRVFRFSSGAFKVLSVVSLPEMPNRCLGIPEVLLIVAQELRTQSLPSVLSLALTNSAICEPCLDVLWEEQTTLIPFLKLFPEYEMRVRPDRFPGVTSKPEEIHEVVSEYASRTQVHQRLVS